MLIIKTQKLIESLFLKGMAQAHMAYDFTICKSSAIPAELKKSVRKNSSNFFNEGSETQYVVLKVPENRKEPSDATSKIVQLIKTNFLDGDPNNTFTTSEVQVGYIELKSKQVDEDEAENKSDKTEEETEEKAEPEKRMYYVLKFRIEK